MENPMLYRRFLAELAVLIALGIAAGILATALLTGVFYIGFLGLTAKGLDPFSAMGILCGFALMGMLTLFFIIQARLQNLKDLAPRRPAAEEAEMNPVEGAKNIYEAFMAGFRKPPKARSVNARLH